MQIEIIDTLPAYRLLLQTPDAAAREQIFRQELIAPFRGLVDYFGGDGLAVFASWQMAPEQFAGDNRPAMARLVQALEEARAPQRARQALEEGIAAFATVAGPLPLEKLTFGLYLADMSSTPWNEGYTGFGAIPGWIMTVYGEASDYNLARLEAATVHELHHNLTAALKQARPEMGGPLDMRTATLGAYIVNEGLAESFAAELYGAEMVGPWVSRFDEAEVTQLTPRFAAALDLQGFAEIRPYVFGDPQQDIPPTAGYALGYHAVQAYLQRSGCTVVEATLHPPEQILAESGFF